MNKSSAGEGAGPSTLAVDCIATPSASRRGEPAPAEAKHTPGPWLAEIRNDRPPFVRRAESIHGWICDCPAAFEREQTIANARLIAAAPDLLNGCNALLGLLQLLAGRDDVSPALREHLKTGHRIDEARAAIAKAIGAA